MKVPVVLQTNSTECGIACLAMVAAALGRPVGIADMRRRAGLSTLGNTLAALMDLAATLGLHTRALRLEPDDAPRLATPCILLWGTRHFVVLRRATRRAWTIHDPAVGVRRYRRAEIHRHFSGVALELATADAHWHEPPSRPLRLATLWAQVTGVVPVLLWLFALSVVLQLVALVSPLYVQLVVDQGLARNDRELIPLLAVGFGALVAIGAVTGHLRSLIALRAGNALNDQLAANLCRHLLHLPFLFFVQRDIGDINARFASLQPVLRVFTSGIVTALIDGLLASTTFVLLFLYERSLALLVIGFLLAGLAAQLMAVGRLRALDADVIRAGAAEQTLFIESLRSILTLKANAMERTRSDLWRSRHIESVDASARRSLFGFRLELLRAMLTGGENALVVYLGAHAVMDSALTIGMLYAFIAYKSHFVRATTGLIEQMIELRLLRLHLDRLSDIVHTPAELPNPEQLIEAGIKGAIAAREVRFRYAPALPEILQGISFAVAAGEEVAIVGGSGSGKSTLLRILLGLVEPTSGTVVLDGKRALAQCRSAVKAGTGAVLQGDALFTGSIRDNVSLFALDVDPERVVECCRIAAIDDDIGALPMGYDTAIGDMGITLSAGQMQRLLVARALYKSPRILVLDEATANLDDETRARLNGNLRRLGITLIRVTHRDDEIAACSAVYRLAQGVLCRWEWH